MRIKTTIVTLLVRLYPAAWRAEYGLELEDLLLRLPLAAGTVVDVMAGGLRQRLQRADFALLAGFVAAGVVAFEIAAGAPVLRDSGITLPRLVIGPLRSVAFSLLLAVCGWLQRDPWRGGRAAVRAAALAGAPVGIWGLFHLHDPHAAAILIAPWFGLPQSWLWGVVGGLFGRARQRFFISCALFAVVLSAQEPAHFEVATVKPNRSGDRGGSLHPMAGGRVEARNLPLVNLISFAFQLPGFQIVDVPNWVGDERYDIVAKLEGDLGPDALAPAMRSLLAERFHLQTHLETRDTAIYALVMAHSGGTPGPALKQTTQDCSPLAVKARRDTPPPADTTECGMRFGRGHLSVGGMPISSFASSISGLLGRVVEDRTGLSENWDFELTFAPEMPAGAPPEPAADPALPSIFTAVQEQLGLKFQATKGPVKVLVLDRIERPAPE